jgi:hypothetical protein
MGDDCCIYRSQKLLHNERHVSWSIVMMLGPGVVAPDVCMFVLDVLTSTTSELRKRLFWSLSVLVEQIPYALCLQYQTFATFSVIVPVEGRPECSSSLTDIRLFLKHLYHSYVCVWPTALSPNASLSIMCISEAVLLSLEQNLMQIRCSFT